MKKTLVILKLEERTVTALKEIDGYDMRFVLPENLTDEDLAWAEVIVGEPTKDMIAKATNLKWIQIASAGVNNYEGLDESITLSNAYGAYGPGIAEYMVGAVLAIDRKLYDYAEQQKERTWKCLGFGKGIENMKVLSVGMGAIGTEFLKRMNLLGAECYGVRRTVHEKPDFVKEVYTTEKLDELLPQMDVVALSMPQTPETIGMFNKERLEKIPRGAILINVGRGTAIDQTALIPMVENDYFAGVVLDVTTPEPLPVNSPLWNSKHCYITPHISGRFTNPANYDRVVNVILENLRRAAEGKELLHVVKKATGGY